MFSLGVIWHPQGPIDGAIDLIKTLRNMVNILNLKAQLQSDFYCVYTIVKYIKQLAKIASV